MGLTPAPAARSPARPRPPPPAAKGTLLSRLGATLDVEVIGPRAIVSLVDPATRDGGGLALTGHF